MLDQWETHYAQPQWLEALRRNGLFQLLPVPASASEHPSVRFVVNEQAAFAGLAWLLTRPSAPLEGAPERDPVSGDEFTERRQMFGQVQWPEAMKSAFSRIVQDYLAQTPRHPSADLFHFHTSNAALLLACACAGGDVNSVCDLMTRFPYAAETPLSDALLHLEESDRLRVIKSGYSFDVMSITTCTEIAPALLAIEHNRLDVLTAMHEHGCSVLGHLAWVRSVGEHKGRTPEAVPKTFIDLLYYGAPTAHVWNPSTTEYLLREFAALAPAKMHQHGSAKLSEFVANAMAEEGWEHLEGPLIRSGVMKLFGNECFGTAARLGKLSILEAMRSDVYWPDHQGDEFPPYQALFGSNPQISLTLARWCLEDGHSELLSGPQKNGAGELLFMAHAFASCGCADVVHLMLEQGFDLAAQDKKGQTVLQAAQAAGKEDVAFLVRSFLAQKHMHQILSGGEDLDNDHGLVAAAVRR